NAQFWCEENQCLYDVIDGARRDATVRPNQLLAISLPHPVLDRLRWRAVISTVRNRLLTPAGVRTLEPADPRYMGRYGGTILERDAALHNGCIHPWLLGHYVSALLRAEERDDKSLAESAHRLEPLLARLRTQG